MVKTELFKETNNLSLRTLITLNDPAKSEVPKAGARHPLSVCIRFIIFLICVKRQ